MAKVASNDEAIDGLRKLLRIFRVAPVDRTVLELTAHSSFTDFEDAVLHEAGCLAGAEAIVIRNPADFASSRLRVHIPEDLEAMLRLDEAL